jgi:hypothetical protein
VTGVTRNRLRSDARWKEDGQHEQGRCPEQPGGAADGSTPRGASSGPHRAVGMGFDTNKRAVTVGISHSTKVPVRLTAPVIVRRATRRPRSEQAIGYRFVAFGQARVVGIRWARNRNLSDKRRLLHASNEPAWPGHVTTPAATQGVRSRYPSIKGTGRVPRLRRSNASSGRATRMPGRISHLRRQRGPARFCRICCRRSHG